MSDDATNDNNNNNNNNITSPSAIDDLTDTLTSSPHTWVNASLVSVTQICPDGLDLLFRTALSMRRLVLLDQSGGGGGDDRLRHKVLATVFYEASTRTSCSFQTAMLRLGGRVVHVDAGQSGNSSAGKKGETLSDTIRCLQCYADVVVLRHPVVGSVRGVVLGSRSSTGTSSNNKPILNAGDGVGEHPTQALLDLFTIRDELGLLPHDDNNDNKEESNTSIEDDDKPKHKSLTIVFLGDLKHGRTVHSLAKLLARSSSSSSSSGGSSNDTTTTTTMTLRYCSPPSLTMPAAVRNYVASYGLIQEDCTDLTEAVRDADVLYVTRIQKERFATEDDYDAAVKRSKDAYTVNAALMKRAPPKMVVLHPLPRVGEITEEVDADPRAAYFRQMENGMYVRMALLALVLNKA